MCLPGTGKVMRPDSRSCPSGGRSSPHAAQHRPKGGGMHRECRRCEEPGLLESSSGEPSLSGPEPARYSRFVSIRSSLPERGVEDWMETNRLLRGPGEKVPPLCGFNGSVTVRS